MALAERLLAASDPLRVTDWEQLLAEDVHVRVANRKPAIGRSKAVRELMLLFAGVETLGRGLRELWPSEDGQTVLMELELWPVLGPPIPMAIVARTAPAATLAKDVRFYFDPAPLRARLNDGNGAGSFSPADR